MRIKLRSLKAGRNRIRKNLMNSFRSLRRRINGSKSIPVTMPEEKPEIMDPIFEEDTTA